jgi:hypothetical protein
MSERNCTTHFEACDCKQAAHRAELDALRAQLREVEERASTLLLDANKSEDRLTRQRDALKVAVKRMYDLAFTAAHLAGCAYCGWKKWLPDLSGSEILAVLRYHVEHDCPNHPMRAAEAALKEAEWRAAEWERASGLNATEMSRYQRQAIAAETLAERYREALVKAEAFLDENDYRLPMSGREAAALATIRIALQQGKGDK